MSLIMLLGPPGSGKGEQCTRLVSKGWETVSTGQLLRSASSKNDEFGMALKHMLNKGELVPDHIVIDLLKQHLGGQVGDKLILDGFPRTLAQVHAMSQLELMPEKIFVLVIPDEVIIERLGGRWIEPKSGRVYHDKYHPPKVEGVDDITGDPLKKRDDDKPEVISKRLMSYHKEVEEMLGFYQSYQTHHSLSLTYIDATDSIDSVHDVIEGML